MIISVNWLKKYTDIKLPIDELASLIGARLVEIEGIEELGNKYKDVVIVKVVECEKLADSDHLSLTKVDDGGAVKDIERDNKGLIQVVCGAPNITKGMTVAWLPPKSIVPETYSSKEPFVLGARKLMGHTSNGMIASAKELDLYDDHTGIVELDRSLKAGQKLVEALELDDHLLDIENKSLTHRPDTFGIIGFAREVAGIQDIPFNTPDWLLNTKPELSVEGKTEIKVTIDDPDLSRRYQAVVLEGANENAKSPLYIQSYLVRSGVRPINAIVDATNYIMLLTGQPLHAFDYDKVVKVGGSADIHVRAGKKGEKLELLDGRTIKLDPGDIVIAAGDTAIGLAGAMGGASTEIDSSTKRIILESATFNLYNLRSTQMRHGIFSEAITRFTKGQPADLTAPVLAETVRLINEWTGANPTSAVAESYTDKTTHQPISIALETINNTLGSNFGTETVVQTLENVGFSIEIEPSAIIKVTAPYWREDIHIPEDVIEEIGRLNGFDSITPTLPERDFTAVSPDDFDKLRQRLRVILVRGGANEVLSYSFVHGDLMRRAGQNPDTAYKIVNSISPDLQYYRQSLTPSLISMIHPNIKAGFDHFAIFEINKFHTKLHDVNEEGVPKELDGLALVVANKKSSKDSPYYEAKRYLDYLADTLGIELVYEPLEEDSDYPVTQPFEPKRSARIWEKHTRERVGVIGEFRHSVKKAFKLPEHAAGFEISPRGLLKVASGTKYQPLSKYPGTDRDICFKVSGDINYQQVLDIAKEALDDSDLIFKIAPVDIYQKDNGKDKNITIRISLASYDHTLKAEEVAKIIKNVSEKMKKEIGATVV